MTARPGFWLTVVPLAVLFAGSLAYRADHASVGDVAAWCFAVGVLAWALMRWSEE